ncbi:hypothetical protein GRI97_05460 [Altererythrobacter xixiisoli]|uniref:TonB C-terminal domain-containing protein n=1 Tax=Croceibacterium xixiisoli TaxID=1476466 RepID=A0A6I4TR99_9SPHN|nr:energy transducer TonB [Croceibacterium xixiisoli]MXO98432.1 hypothetical protein [Croceibacterium xixiisoli]
MGVSAVAQQATPVATTAQRVVAAPGASQRIGAWSISPLDQARCAMRARGGPGLASAIRLREMRYDYDGMALFLQFHLDGETPPAGSYLVTLGGQPVAQARLAADGAGALLRVPVDSARLPLVRAGGALSFVHDGVAVLSGTLPVVPAGNSAADGFAALAQCQQQLSVDPFRLSPNRAAAPRFSDDMLFTDFPLSDVPGVSRATRFMAQLRYGASGRVESCAVTRSSGVAAVDDTLCDLLQRRARFSPATNAQAQPQPGSYRVQINPRRLARDQLECQLVDGC